MSVTAHSSAGVEAVHVAQQQQVAVGGPQPAQRGVRCLLDAVLDAAEVVVAGRAGRAPRELVEGMLAHQAVEPLLRLRPRRSGAPAQLAPAGGQRRKQAALAVTEPAEHARGIGEEGRLVARRERDVRLGISVARTAHELPVAERLHRGR